MKIEGKLIVTLFDGVEQYHPNGVWTISRGDKVVARSVNRERWSKDVYPLRGRLSEVKNGDYISASSYTGKTGVRGEIISRSGNYIIVTGEAWGSTQCAYSRGGRVGFSAYTFQVDGLEAAYCGSIKELKGVRADHELIRKIESLIYEVEAPSVEDARV
jgi:hypothetical protein